MSRCNVDFFTTKFEYIYNDSIETPGIDFDYLTPEASTFDIGETSLVNVQNMAVFEDRTNYVAIVDKIKLGEGKTTVSVKPFLSMFDQSMLFNCNWQYNYNGSSWVATSESKTLENTIADLIKQYWINASDGLQNIPLQIYTTSSTSNWSFGLIGDRSDDDKATSANNHFCIVEFYDSILQNALIRYRVSVIPELDIANKRIKLVIGAPTGNGLIEADIPDVDVIDFTIGKLDSGTNKLEIWNEDNYTEKIYYYLHTNGSYDTNGSTNRITPIKMEVISSRPERNSSNTITKTFAVVAKNQADQKFGNLRWKNHIELDLDVGNIFDATNMRIGQKTTIIYQGKTYETILTGKKVSDVLTLIFGTIRVDLTKKLQLEASEKYTDTKSVTKNSSTSSS